MAELEALILQHLINSHISFSIMLFYCAAYVPLSLSRILYVAEYLKQNYNIALWLDSVMLLSLKNGFNDKCSVNVMFIVRCISHMQINSY